LLNALLALLFVLCRPSASLGQNGIKAIQISQEDVAELIGSYRSDDPAKTVATWRRKMAPPATDQTFRAAIWRSLPVEFTKLIINDPQLAEGVRRVLDPVLSLYGRSRVYDLIIIDAATPMIMADSGVLLMISTGMVERAQSDDELLGYAAHETGHEFFVKYSVATNYLQSTIMAGGNEPVLARRAAELLAIIELQCDAFAALTLASLGYNPREFVKAIEQDSRDFPDYRTRAHPAEAERRKVVEDVVPAAALKVPPRQSKAFYHLKQMLIQYQSVKRSHPADSPGSR
jgi:hypothetical protein